MILRNPFLLFIQVLLHVRAICASAFSYTETQPARYAAWSTYPPMYGIDTNSSSLRTTTPSLVAHRVPPSATSSTPTDIRRSARPVPISGHDRGAESMILRNPFLLVIQVDITPAEIEADSSWMRAMRAHHALAVHQPITSMPPFSTSSQKTTPPRNTTSALPLFVVTLTSLNSLWRNSRSSSDQEGGLDLRTTKNGVLLKTLCSLATIDYVDDSERINLYNNSPTASTSSESRSSSPVVPSFPVTIAASLFYSNPGTTRAPHPPLLNTSKATPPVRHLRSRTPKLWLSKPQVLPESSKFKSLRVSYRPYWHVSPRPVRLLLLVSQLQPLHKRRLHHQLRIS
ncbi:hypothetical protein MRX96_021742 [Rhipicephalus microplus]